MSDRTDRRPQFNPQTALEAERQALIARRAELTDAHDRIVRHIDEGRDLLRRMSAHGEQATLTLELHQALPGLLVSDEQALESLAVLLGATEAIELIQAGLATSDLEHLAIHVEEMVVDAAIAETEAALARLASQTAEPVDQSREPAPAAEARAAS